MNGAVGMGPELSALARAVMVVSAALVATACGGSRDRVTPDVTDGGAGSDAGVASPYEPVAPMTPMPVSSCTSGMRALALGSGATACEVDPDAAPCDDTSARFYGSADCVPVGDACPAGPFPDVPSDVTAVYVLAGAAPGGDGTMSRPFATLRASFAAARAGTTIVVGKGVYSEGATTLPAGVRLLGACAAETRFTATGIAAPYAILRAASPDIVIEQVTIGPSSALGLQVEGGALTVHDVIVRDASTVGVSVLRGSLSGDHLVVRRVAPDRTFDDSGWGVFVEAGGVVDLDALVIEEAGELGVLAVMTANVVLRGVVIRDSRGAPTGLPGGGILAQDGATVEIEGAVIANVPQGGLMSWDGSHMTARDVVIAEARGESTPTNIAGFGVSVDGAGADLTLERAAIGHTRLPAVLARDGATLSASDVVAFDAPVGLGGRGNVEMALSRAIFDGVANGVLLQGPGVTAELSDLRVHATMLIDGRQGGFGLTMSRGGTITLSRVSVVDAMVTGIAMADVDTVLHARDVLVTGTRGFGPDEQWGQGIAANRGASVDVTRARIEGNHELQVGAFAEGTRVELTEVTVRRALARACEATSCNDVAGGSSIGAYGGATLVARTFEVDEARLCGLQVATGAMLDATDGVVRHASIGACVQVPSYDLNRITATVTYADNGINVDTMDLPVPMPVEDLGAL